MAEFSDMTTIIKFKLPVVNIFTYRGTYILIRVFYFFGYISEGKRGGVSGGWQREQGEMDIQRLVGAMDA